MKNLAGSADGEIQTGEKFTLKGGALGVQRMSGQGGVAVTAGVKVYASRKARQLCDLRRPVLCAHQQKSGEKPTAGTACLPFRFGFAFFCLFHYACQCVDYFDGHKE
jgi:hypothetical protein